MKESEIKKEIDDIFSRAVGNFVDPDGSFRKKLEAKAKGEYKKDIIIKLGADPTRPDLHLGHAVVLRKLRKLQELGCKVVFIVGDFTTLIGDPTGKSKTRPNAQIHNDMNKTAPSSSVGTIPEGIQGEQDTSAPEVPTSQEIAKNMETYIEQISKTKILDVSASNFSWIKNSDWFFNTTDMIYETGAKAVININFSENGINKKISVEIDPNSFFGKALLFEKTRMQTTIRPGQITLITVRGLLWTLQHITHSQLINRDMFQERIKNGAELYMHEMLYPVMQGIDSYMLSQIYGSCDMEVGGTDQTFNMLMGRDVMKANNVDPQAVLSFELLEGLDGKEKMSKSLDNYIGITDEPSNMYGKIMSLPDQLIGKYFELCTFTPMEEVQKIKESIKNGDTHPKDAKMNLARQIVEIYHGKTNAEKAEENFVNTFQKKEIPNQMEEIKISKGKKLSEILVQEGIVTSKTEWKRLIDEGAVTNLESGEKISDSNFIPLGGEKLKIGKKRFIKIS